MKRIRQIRVTFGLTGLVAIGEAIAGFIQGGVLMCFISVLLLIAAFICGYVIKNIKSLIKQGYL